MSALAVIAAVLLPAAALGARPPPGPAPCNSELRHEQASLVTRGAEEGERGALPAKLITLPQRKGEEASFPAALDGSPYAFYYAPSTTNSTLWSINIQGGGWVSQSILHDPLPLCFPSRLRGSNHSVSCPLMLAVCPPVMTKKIATVAHMVRWGLRWGAYLACGAGVQVQGQTCVPGMWWSRHGVGAECL